MTQTPEGERDPSHPLKSAWTGQRDWRLLVTRFEPGLHFLATWQAWRQDTKRPRRLHYVGLSNAPPSMDELVTCASAHPELLAMAQEMACQWHALQPGFHRFTLEQGNLLLTLCIGEWIPLLREQHFLADEVVLDVVPGQPASPPWSRWHAKALARCCRRATVLTVTGGAQTVQADLTHCGFEFQPQTAGGPDADQGRLLRGQFNPRWTLRAHQVVPSAHARQPGTCAVVGAGLAGASVAAALARRGWQVQVLDGANAPANGASGLPVGLVVPHVSVDDCVLSRLSRAGVRLMLHEARTLLMEGHDWAPSGVLERCLDEDLHPPDPLTSIWHAHAAWLKPGQLVRAWLAQPGITFLGGVAVAALRPADGQWELLDDQGSMLARTDRIVLANACGAPPLLATLDARHSTRGLLRPPLPALHGVRGQVSWALHGQWPDAAFPAHPINGAGSVIPGVPWQDGLHSGPAWFAGATYQPDEQPEFPDDINHGANLVRVQRLLPEFGRVVAPSFASGQVHAWKSTRCVSADRLPLVGPVDEAGHPGLWICAGMGSRGLSFSVLCAEWLAAQWHAEPWVIEARLARMLTAQRGVPARCEPINDKITI